MYFFAIFQLTMQLKQLFELCSVTAVNSTIMP